METNDFCSLLIPLAIVLFVGRRVVNQSPRLKGCGIAFAVIVFLWHGATLYQEMVSPIQTKTGRQLDADQPFTDLSLAWKIAIPALLMGAWSLGIAWLALTSVAFSYQLILSPIAKWSNHKWNFILALANSMIRSRANRQAQRLHDEEQTRRSPERERARIDAETVSRNAAEAQLRRENARLACECLYQLHAPEIQGRLSKETIAEFINKYLGDNRTPEFVEDRAVELKSIIQQHLNKSEPESARFKSLEDLARWYESIRSQIEAQAIEDRFKKAQLAQLRARYQSLVDNFLENAQP